MELKFSGKVEDTISVLGWDIICEWFSVVIWEFGHILCIVQGPHRCLPGAQALDHSGCVTDGLEHRSEVGWLLKLDVLE